METTGEKLRALRERAGLDRAEVARHLAMKYTSYQYYEEEFTKGEFPWKLSVPLRRLILSRSNITPRELDTVLPLPPGFRDTRDVPLITWVQAGQPLERLEESVGDAAKYPISYLPGRLFALRVEGNSMSRVAPHGAVIIVDMDDIEPVDGKCYVARNGEGITFKRYRATPPRLESYSVEQPTESLFGEFELIGRAIKVEQDL